MPTPISIDSSKRESVAPPTTFPKQILYLTFDGVLEPLGRSQILGYLRHLTCHEFSYTLISLERHQDLVNTSAVAETRELLLQNGIEWIPLPYAAGGIRKVLANFRSMAAAARRVIQTKGIHLIHARAHVTSFVALYLKRTTRVPYIFDARGYWIEEKAEEGMWFTRQFIHNLAKRMERQAFRSAAGVVTLTQIMADDLRHGILRDREEIPIVVIPTCADFEQFRLCPPSNVMVPAETRERLKNKLVIGMVGAINSSYFVGEALQIFRCLRQFRTDAHLLWVTRQGDVALSLLQRAGIDPHDVTVAETSHQQMPGWMGLMNWGFLLLKQTFSKRGSMPTKLAEMLATGVRPIYFGCNAEVGERIWEAGSGISLPDLTPLSLETAAKRIATFPPKTSDLEHARNISMGWFSMETGARKYDMLLRQILT